MSTPAAPAARPTAVATPSIPTISLRQLWPFLVFGIVLALLAVYFIGAEQGALQVFSGTGVHEWVHDGRHLLGFPCH